MRLRAPPLAALAAFALAALGPASALADDTPEEARDAFVHDQRNLMTVLGVYSLSSMAVGGAMLASSQPEVRAAGVQNLAWGAVDGAIALVALVGVNKLSHDDRSAAYWADERSTTRTIFAVNAGLDVLYITTGALLLALGKTDFVRGTGGGVLAQGGFLFAFDTSAAFVMARRR